MTVVVTPLLKSAEWAEQATQRGLLFSPLSTALDSLPAMAPAIAYAIDQGETVAFLPATETNQQNFAEIHAQALASLRQRLSAIDWEPVGGVDTLKNVWVFGGDFNAAECLLLPERLQEAHSITQSPSLLACTPTRGALLVWPYAKEDKPALEAFIDFCHQLYYDEDNECISPVIWGVVQGEIKDAMKIDEAYLQYLRSRFSAAAPSAASDAVDTQREPPAKLDSKRLYSIGQVVFMSLFGTIFAGLFGMYRNYRTLGAFAAARNTLIAGVVLVPLNIWLFLEVPRGAYDKLFPLFPALFMGVACALFQRRALRAALNNGALSRKVWDQCLVIAASLLLMLPVVALVVSFVPPLAS